MPEPWEAVEAHSDYSSTASPVPGSGFSQAWAESLEAMTPSRRRRADVDEAYELQTKAAVEGAARFTGVGLGLAIIAHYSWPLFRRQTLAFKGFLVSACTIFGLVLSADNALLAHESERRLSENKIRREARIDLARRGLVGTETEIRKWRAERDETDVD